MLPLLLGGVGAGGGGGGGGGAGCKVGAVVSLGLVGSELLRDLGVFVRLRCLGCSSTGGVGAAVGSGAGGSKAGGGGGGGANSGSGSGSGALGCTAGAGVGRSTVALLPPVGRVTSKVIPNPAAANPTIAATATAVRRLGRKSMSTSIASPVAFRKVVDCLMFAGGTEGGREDCGNREVPVGGYVPGVSETGAGVMVRSNAKAGFDGLGGRASVRMAVLPTTGVVMWIGPVCTPRLLRSATCRSYIDW